MKGVSPAITQRWFHSNKEKAQKKFIEISHAYEASLYQVLVWKKVGLRVCIPPGVSMSLTYCGFAVLVRDPCWN